ncbi:ATP-dependent DNA helicase RecG [Mesorhizobium sp. M1A.F.Ca.IN.020.06.1.1]|uniref:ATP-dependent DNA helicase RecG n=2 Tax=Mesorhizobium TaxID=68287 RepID=UPI000BAE6CC3|nr:MULTISPECIES: ATP-dependent DNA helicase RecG [unclassified Mesorhizobium]PBB30905.1 ATP-dependent DNA helicase RecG [Mesorhizobium sp. WSM3882]RUU95725.1 ATP-dependent DNA helicase RecG [Mesorhizobium sp. M1A.F.Ca.IN.020.03.2.1]RUV87997.1 ATP-dependent DNA helicase RecG [Mesorhizobium sp. M1A.F.Ca.IN.020.32.1.1]RUW05269.1 ATP-dependent DNA helicase RecG [Mesorhizobium sp. M1A.F.Ca.IN.022.05.2.1]RUW30396.1 ATP-dependent DNA helicase RecG [Mesorhizobium sp. M1A.F.Ca.IN.020.06.1.1]
MRPSILDPLFVPITSLAGVGQKVGTMIERVVPADLGDRAARAADLLFVLPNTVIDRRNRPGIALAAEGQIVTLEVRVDRHQPPPRGNRSVPYRIYAHDDTGEIALTFFHAHAAYLQKMLPEGERVVISGRMEWFNGRPTMVHPDHIAPLDEAEGLPLVEPVYPLTAGLSAKVLRRAIGQALGRLPELPEWQDDAFMRRHTFPSFGDALIRIHYPKDPIDVAVEGAAWRRLAYDELLAGQVSLALVRTRIRRLSGRPLVGDGRVVEKLRAALPYKLTLSQEFALGEINADLADPERMLRLLQGDVGSGKTVVALLAMGRAVEAGGQAALMAPTEILARQHLATIAPLAEKAGLSVAVLTGREKGRERAETLEGLASGAIDIVVGTHALFQETVTFHDLVLAVVDEQHRFGVHQRLAITAKGDAPDMLVMTATPIPRTLVLTAFGDMDVSKLTEKPAGRQPIRTVTLPMERLDELVGRMVDAVAEGQKIYWICPLVEESEEIKLMSAEDRFASLKPLFGEQIGLVHGRMKGAEKDDAMRAFKQGETRILIATTVIEVGVDVPDATIIIIEHAERFGLAQLHQLRGRVGRGDKPSSCVLLYKDPLGETAKRRLSVMRETEDGFRIAEEDLKLRGEGELLGTRQSGTPGFQVARIEFHADLLEAARDDARLILSRDPELQSGRGEALRLLLYLFGRDEAVRLLRAG